MMTHFAGILPHITRPSRYLGNEINSIHKDLDRMSVKFLLAFPDVYEIGMSHLGFQILYHLLNTQEEVGAERVFAPWVDLEKVLRERKHPLVSLESRRPLSDFDIIGFSLQYELSYTNVLSMLDLGKIPFRFKDRTEKNPLIIAGGPCAFNPEPMAEFFDAFVIGEGEEVILEIVDVFKEWKKKNGKRGELLERLTAITGVYVPSWFEVTYQSSGKIAEMKALKPQYNKIKKRIIADLEKVYYPTKFIVPFTQIVHDHLNLEVARGCTRGCRFCQAGMVYRPVRERPCSLVEKIAEETLHATGWEELSLLSLSSGDYSEIESLLPKLITKHLPHHVNISFPSLRAETIHSQWLQSIEGGRKIGFTIAPETGTERLRRLINKRLTEDEILETCHRVFSAGWRSMKLYFMLGLPTETQEDLEGIVALTKKIFFLSKSLVKRPEVTISASTFIPKPHTPFQWDSMITVDEIKFRQDFLLNLIKKSRISFKWQDPEMSILEGVITRGDRRLAWVIEEAFQNGARFDGWTELFNFEVWKKAFHKMGLTMSSYLHSQDDTALLPWDHIETGVTKDFLRQEHLNSKFDIDTADCRQGTCNQCGVCDFKLIYPRIQSQKNKPKKQFLEPQGTKPEEKITRVRLSFSKRKEARFLSQLELARALFRATRRAMLLLKYSQGFHPQPRISFGPALAVGLESMEELMDMELKGDISVETIINRLNQELPQGLRILSGKEIPLQTPAISDNLLEISYSIQYDSAALLSHYSFGELRRIFAEFTRKMNFFITKQHKGKKQSFDIRSAVKELTFSDEKTIEFTLWPSQSHGVKPDEIIGTILTIPENDFKNLPVCKTRVKLR